MASGGWGGAASFSANPFSQPATTQAADVDNVPQAAANAGAWGSTPAVPFDVQQAAATSSTQKKSFFSRAPSNKAPTAAQAAVAVPAVSAFAAAGAAGGSDLAMREAEVARREQQVAAREAAMGAGGGPVGGRRGPNFPPFCPFIYHDISAEIPPWNRSKLRLCFIVELFVLLGFAYNTIIMLVAMFANVSGIEVKWWLIALIAFLIGVPASWWGWYKSIYRLAQTDGATYAFFRTLILIFLNIAWCVWMVLAIDGLGDFSAGIFPTMALFQDGGSKNIAFGICFIVNIVLWGLAGLGSWLALGLAVQMYRKGTDAREQYEQSFGPWTQV